MTVSPDDMVLFAAVVQWGGFTAAAASLGVSKQSVSARVAALERTLGVRLLERSTRVVRPTEAGARYAEHCVALARRVDDANDEVRRSQTEPAGLLRVSAPVLYGRRFLAPVMARFLARYPRVRVELSLSDRRVDLLAEHFDVAIRVGDVDEASLAARPLGHAGVHIVASRAFLERWRINAPDDLRAVPSVGLAPVETWRVNGTEVKLSPAFVANDLEVCTEAAIAGLGVARLPAIVCRDAVLEGRLALPFGLAPVMTRPLFAVFPAGPRQPAKTRAFVDLLAKEVAAMPALVASEHPRVGENAPRIPGHSSSRSASPRRRARAN